MGRLRNKRKDPLQTLATRNDCDETESLQELGFLFGVEQLSLFFLLAVMLSYFILLFSFISQIDSMQPCVCSQMSSKCGKNKKGGTDSPLLLNRRTATWNLFVLYNKETNYFSLFFFQNLSKLLESRPLSSLGNTKKGHLT